jgi:proline/betaine transport protein TphA
MRNNKIIYYAGVVGNALEWYDFTTYAFFAPIFAELFFPARHMAASLLLTFSVFALGFLVRPLGGVLFGYWGDRWGRRRALIISIACMSLPTLLLACLPTYAQAGLAAPLLLTLLRIFQGLAVSGELTSASAFLIEHAGLKNRGFAGSMAMCSGFLGITISAAVSMLLHNFITYEQLHLWGWRLPFFLGAVLGIVGLVIRLKSQETALFQQIVLKNAMPKTSLIPHFWNLVKQKFVWLAALITCIMAVGNWFLIGYFNTFLIKVARMPAGQVMTINFLCLLILTLLLPIAGSISDKVGRKPVLMTGIIGFIVLSFPIFWLLHHGQAPLAFLGEILFVITLAPITATIPAVLAELFHVHVRNMGMSLGYNISQALFGGTAPLIAVALVSSTGLYYAPAFYLIGCALLSGLAVILITETAKLQLQ